MPVRHTGAHPPQPKKEPARPKRSADPADAAVVVALLRFKQASKEVVEKSRQLKRASERMRDAAAILNKLMARRRSNEEARSQGARRKAGRK